MSSFLSKIPLNKEMQPPPGPLDPRSVPKCLYTCPALDDDGRSWTTGGSLDYGEAWYTLAASISIRNDNQSFISYSQCPLIQNKGNTTISQIEYPS